MIMLGERYFNEKFFMKIFIANEKIYFDYFGRASPFCSHLRTKDDFK